MVKTGKIMNIVLASSSIYRKALLDKLLLPFTCYSPDINEMQLEGESAHDLVSRLALTKAQTTGRSKPSSLIIGSDQVAVIEGEILTKPGNFTNAVKQLTTLSGNSATFLTGLCLYNSKDESYQLEVDSFTVHFKELSTPQIKGYLEREQPYNCAGSFKSEGLGITLFNRLEGDDPNSLIGLPLIRLTKMLKVHGIDPLL